MRQTYLPLAISLSVAVSTPFFLYNTSSLWIAAFGAIVIFINVVLLPLVIGLYVSKPNVDMAYYFLGLIGVVLFFEAERYERELSELRQNNFELSQEVQEITQQIISEKTRIELEIDSKNINTDRMREVSKSEDEIFKELTRGESNLGESIVEDVRSRAQLRRDLVEADGDQFELQLLDEILEKTTLLDLAEYHNFGPRQANLIRILMDPDEELISSRVRECVLKQALECVISPDAFTREEQSIQQLMAELEDYENGTASIYSRLKGAEEMKENSDEKLSEALEQRINGTSIQDGIFVYADNFRRTFWPYAIIIAFSLKLASANSARSNEARESKKRALDTYRRVAIEAPESSKEGAQAIKRAFRTAHRRYRKAETLGEVKEYLEILLRLVASAEIGGHAKIAINELRKIWNIAKKTNILSLTSSGINVKAKVLQEVGDHFVLLGLDDQALPCFLESFDEYREVQGRTFSEDSVFFIATAIIRIAIVKTRLRKSASAKDWFERLLPLRDKMSTEHNLELDEMIDRARSALAELPS